MVDLVGINTNDNEIKNYSIKLLRINKNMVTKEFLKSINMSDIVSISISL